MEDILNAEEVVVAKISTDRKRLLDALQQAAEREDAQWTRRTDPNDESKDLLVVYATYSAIGDGLPFYRGIVQRSIPGGSEVRRSEMYKSGKDWNRQNQRRGWRNIQSNNNSSPNS